MQLKLETEKQKFYHLYAEVCEDLPGDFVNPMWEAGCRVSPGRLQHIRYGRTVDLNTLVAMIKVCLPNYTIPAELNIDTPNAA